MDKRIVLLSDTHTLHRKITIPDGDLIIHCGDALAYGTKEEFVDFLDWYRDLPHKYKIYVAGNHDKFIEEMSKEYIRNFFAINGIVYLQDSFIIWEGFKIWGAPWTPVFYNWSFMLQRGEPIAEKWALIPQDTDILITHGPPYGIGDACPMRVGCEDLFRRVHDINPLLHAFGHVHEGFGIYRKEFTFHINCSSLDKRYEYVNHPVVVEVNPESREIFSVS